MMCSNTLWDDSSSRQLDLSFLGAAQFLLKATRLVLSRCCLWLVQILSSIPFLLALTSSTGNFEYHLFQVLSNFSFLSFFSMVFYCDVEFFYTCNLIS